jgi:hypothetical protein
VGEPEPRIYPCARCGVMRTKSEGGTVFTVCDWCWEAYPPTPLEALFASRDDLATARAWARRWKALAGELRLREDYLRDAVSSAVAEYNTTRIDLAASRAEVERLREKVQEQARQIQIMVDGNHRRNLEMDALHYVWCDGGCKYGVDRWNDRTVTEELVQAAERNTRRLRAWFENAKARALADTREPVEKKDIDE